VKDKLIVIPIILLLAGLAGITEPLRAQEVVVDTTYGKVSGVPNAKIKTVSFKGIPYAEPPVGDLRWRPPQPVKAWRGVRKADKLSPSCMQNTEKEHLPWTAEFMTSNDLSEDCLYLNVWTPQPTTSAKLPVVVFIHGGGFGGGSGGIAIYDGEQLAATGLVVITINYRVSVFGFLALPELTAESEHHSSGNYGLMDQIAALRWIKENISSFGGDPARVTIWGQSAGAFSVQDLIASPLAAGLFSRAAADSGIGIAGLKPATLADAEAEGVKFAASRQAASLKELRAKPAAELLPKNAVFSGASWAPIVDGWLLPASPNQLSEKGADNDIPVMTGYMANDGLLFADPISKVEDYEQNAKKIYGAMTPEFLKLYPATDVEQAKKMNELSTRDRERASAYVWASQRARNHHAPVYTFFFDRAIPWPQHPEFGAFHTGEIPYFFRNLKLLDRPWEPADFTVSEQASGYLKNFATTGDPNGKSLPQWPAAAGSSGTTMEFGSHTGSIPVAEKDRLDFWVRYFSSTEVANAPVF